MPYAKSGQPTPARSPMTRPYAYGFPYPPPHLQKSAQQLDIRDNNSLQTNSTIAYDTKHPHHLKTPRFAIPLRLPKIYEQNIQQACSLKSVRLLFRTTVPSTNKILILQILYDLSIVFPRIALTSEFNTVSQRYYSSPSAHIVANATTKEVILPIHWYNEE